MDEADTGEVVGEPPGAEGTVQPAPEAPGLAVLTEAVSLLRQQVQVYHVRAEARERVIDQLHAEVERLRVGEQGLVLRPVVIDLQNLRADLLRQARTLPTATGREQVVELLESFALSVELALERCGSVPVRPEQGAKFSAREHRAVKVVEASREDEDGTIAEVLADGYRDAGSERVLVAAKVHVRRWIPTQDVGTENKHEPEGSTDV